MKRSHGFFTWILSLVIFCLGVAIPGIGIAQDCTDYSEYFPDSAPLLGELEGSGKLYSVAVSSNRLYVGGTYGVQVFDITSPESPEFLGMGGGPTNKIIANGTRVFAVGEGDLEIIDFSDPAQPQVTEHELSPYSQQDVGLSLSENILVVALNGDIEGRVFIVDVSDPGAPVTMSDIHTRPVTDIMMNGSLAYITTLNWEGGGFLDIWDISDPSNPTEGHQVVFSEAPISMEMVGYILYIGTTGGIEVLNAANAQWPYVLGSVPGVPSAKSLVSDGNLLYAWGTNDTSFWGLLVLDISLPTAPVLLAVENTITYNDGLACLGSTVYAVSYGWGLRVFDVTTPVSPQLRPWAHGLPGYAGSVVATLSHAFLRGNTLQVVDIVDPAQSRLVAELPMSHNARSIAIDDDLLFWAGGDLSIVDVQNPTQPVVRSTIANLGYPYELAIRGNYLYGAGSSDDLTIVNFEDPGAPVLVATWNIDGGSSYSIAIEGSLAYVGVFSYGVVGGLYILDLTDPENPETIGHMPYDSRIENITLAGDRAYMSQGFNHDIVMVDISDPTTPVLVETWDSLGTSFLYQDPYLYVGGSELTVVDVSDPAVLEIVGRAELPSGSWDLAFSGPRICIAAGFNGLFLANSACLDLVAVGEGEGLVPREANLMDAYPNPFNPSTVIRFELTRTSDVTLEVYDLAGRKVSTLVDGMSHSAGMHEVFFHSEGLSSGLYLCRLSVDGESQTMKLMLTK